MKPKPIKFIALNGDNRYARDKGSNLIWHKCQHRVLYADTDRSRIVYHSNYLIYFEIGRTSLMRDAAYPYRLIEESGYLYPIFQIGVNYYNPLRYDDPIFIYTRPSTLERVKIRFEYVITHEKTNELICDGFTWHCATNSSGIPVGIDEKTLHLWENFPK
jgi:acyl-CoA thioester hydrolase